MACHSLFRTLFFLPAVWLPAMLNSATAAPLAASCRDRPVLAMSYNIRLDTPTDGDNAWAFRRDYLIGQIETLRPELFGLQEVLPNQRNDLEAAFPGFTFVGGGRDDGKLAGESSPLAVDNRVFRITRHGMFWLSLTPGTPSLGWDAGYKRVVTWARLRRVSDGLQVLAVNTHWDHIGAIARQNSGAMLRDWIARNRSTADAVVVLGDFNTTAEDPAVAQLTTSGVLRDALTASSRAAFGPKLSFNGFDAAAKEGAIIDHILVSANVSVASSGVIAQHAAGKVASDHFPVVALIELPARRRCR